MKKILMVIVFLLALLLVGCGGKIPDDATVATCPQGDTFKYIYEDAKVYEFYVNDELQSDDMLAIVQAAADAAGDMETYLENTFQDGVCSFTPYTSGNSYYDG